jgi:hypothetical protein
MSLEPGDLQLEFSRKQDVIAVQVLNKLSGCKLTARLSRESGSSVRLMKHPKLLRMRLGKLVGDSRGVVSRSVVYDDYFNREIGLRKHACDGFAKHTCSVVNRDDCGDETGNYQLMTDDG